MRLKLKTEGQELKSLDQKGMIIKSVESWGFNNLALIEELFVINRKAGVLIRLVAFVCLSICTLCGKLSERSDGQTHGAIWVVGMSPAGVFGPIVSVS